ncbi:MAG: hypothetical protein IKQ94_00290 [Bacteroidales bacterium]|nr:hypothetical protein [Bacteroidales bacterium]
MIENLQKHIETIINIAFERVQYAFDHNKENGPVPPDDQNKPVSRIVFPSYSNDGIRISEQELRFCFTEAFNEYFENKNIPIYYSVETPTRKNYSGFSKSKECPNPKPQPNDDGRSGEFDLVIYELEEYKLKRRCLIEFKANNASELDHKKDFVKLNNPDEWSKEGENDVELRYFIELIYGFKAKTLENLGKKTVNKKGTNFVCYSLRDKKNISCEIK